MSDTCTMVFATDNTSALAGCWRPRLCRECLALNGCMIDDYGVCHNLSWAKPSYNYKRAIELNETLPSAIDRWNPALEMHQSWQFPSTETTYCPDDDVVCRECIEERFWADRTTGDNRFCVGANGCVCIKSCHEQIVECENGEVFDDVPTLAPSLPTPNVPSWQECRYTRVDQCYTLRSCHDCLLKQGCRIASDGFCGPDYAGNEDTYDYRHAFSYNISLPAALTTNYSGLDAIQRWHFRALNVSYCPANDTTCQECISERFWLPPDQSADSRFCIGANGCVCVANCVRPENATGNCPQQTTKTADGPALTTYVTLIATGGIVLLLTALGMEILWRRILAELRPRPNRQRTNDAAGQFYSIATPTRDASSHTRSTRALQRLRTLTSAPVASAAQQQSLTRTRSTPTLGLSGWNCHRRALIDAETRTFNGEEATSLERGTAV